MEKKRLWLGLVIGVLILLILITAFGEISNTGDVVLSCNFDAECPVGQICNANHQCVAQCMSDSDCSVGQICNANHQCVAQCMSDSDCSVGKVCIGGKCSTQRHLCTKFTCKIKYLIMKFFRKA